MDFSFVLLGRAYDQIFYWAFFILTSYEFIYWYLILLFNCCQASLTFLTVSICCGDFLDNSCVTYSAHGGGRNQRLPHSGRLPRLGGRAQISLNDAPLPSHQFQKRLRSTMRVNRLRSTFKYAPIKASGNILQCTPVQR